MARKVSTNMSIPLDLTVEILMKLPTKSLARFRCVSYEWASAINKFIVIDSIVIRSLTQPPRDPHFIFDRPSSYDPVLRRVSSETFSTLSYTYLYHQITNEEQLYHEKILGRSNGYQPRFQYVRGLIGSWRSGDNGQFTIHNPTTSQYVFLPVPRLAPRLFYLFGYDPFKNQYKVVCLSKQDQSCKLFILGGPSKEWWNMECSIVRHYPLEQAVCIDGKIYYKASIAKSWSYGLVSFDVRFENFNLVEAPEDLPLHGESLLVNYQGKLGCICCDKYYHDDVDMWVMEDAEKQEWSKKTFFSVLQDLPSRDIRLAGVTHPGGEIIIVHEKYLSEFALEVFYYDPKQNSRRRAEIQTTRSLLRIRPSETVTIWAVTDHVENLITKDALGDN